jgi:hypothetical protein
MSEKDIQKDDLIGSPIPAPSTFMSFVSTPGDWVGQGRSFRLESGQWVFRG